MCCQQEEKERKEMEEQRKKHDEDAKKKKALSNMTQQYSAGQKVVPPLLSEKIPFEHKCKQQTTVNRVAERRERYFSVSSLEESG